VIENATDVIDIYRVLSSTDNNWVDVLSALLTPVIAFLAVMIAFFQWRTNQLRLKHELFDRRYAQYKAVVNFLAHIVRTATVNDEERHKFFISTNGSGFIFDRGVYKYIEEILKKAIHIQSSESRLNAATDREARERIADRRDELFSWCETELNKLHTLEHPFAPYLNLKPPGLIEALKAVKKRIKN
jgi:hypothetical protein